MTTDPCRDTLDPDDPFRCSVDGCPHILSHDLRVWLCVCHAEAEDAERRVA